MNMESLQQTGEYCIMGKIIDCVAHLGQLIQQHLSMPSQGQEQRLQELSKSVDECASSLELPDHKMTQFPKGSLVVFCLISDCKLGETCIQIFHLMRYITIYKYHKYSIRGCATFAGALE